MEQTETDLELFRQQWLEEVSAKTKPQERRADPTRSSQAAHLSAVKDYSLLSLRAMSSDPLPELLLELEQETTTYLGLYSVLPFRLVNRHYNDVSLSAFSAGFLKAKSTFTEPALQKLLAISRSQKVHSAVEQI
jgi:hypothetical protein